MIITVTILTLVSIFLLHIIFLIKYIGTKNKKFLFNFIATGIVNFLLMAILIIISVKKPSYIREVNIGLLMWLISGVFTILLVTVKTVIMLRVYRRTKDQKFYHLNYFGEKVYEKGVITRSEYLTMILTMPFFIVIGSYFVVKLINIIRFKIMFRF